MDGDPKDGTPTEAVAPRPTRQDSAARSPLPRDQLDAAEGRRHVRSAFSEAELERLYDAAARRPLAQAVAQRVNSGVTPRERLRLERLGASRRLVYRVAAGTGLRRKELRRLRRQDLDLDRRDVAIPAASAKSRRNQSVPLRSDLAEELAAFLPADCAPTDLVFPLDLFPNLKTFKLDLVAAGLATVERLDDGTEHILTTDESGLVLDFHCLRGAFVSGLIAKGVHPRVVQVLARHAKVETTMRAYSDARLLDLRGAVEATAPTAARTEGDGVGSSRNSALAGPVARGHSASRWS